MRNLKRALSLALASVMLLGMMVVGTSAAAYPDVTSAHNVEAIEVMKAAEVMIGDENGNFNPDKVVTRAEMSVIICKILYGQDLSVASFADVATFSDVPAWAQGYVNLCANLGIVAGVGDGKFDPSATVTTAQAALMLLRALEVEVEINDNTDYKVAAMTAAEDADLFEGLGILAANAGLTRNNVAQMTLNAMKYNDAETVYVVTNGTKSYEMDEMKDALLYAALLGNGYEVFETKDYSGSLIDEVFEIEVVDSTDAYGRPATAYEHEDWAAALTFAEKADYAFTVEKKTTLGELIEDQKLEKKITSLGGYEANTVLPAGAVVELFVNDDKALTNLVEFGYFMVEIDEINECDEDDDEAAIEDGAEYVIELSNGVTLYDINFPAFDAATYVEGAKLVLTGAVNAYDFEKLEDEFDYVLADCAVAAEVEGKINGLPKDRSYMTIAGKKYYASASFGTTMSNGDEGTFYLDPNGFVVGFAEEEEAAVKIDDVIYTIATYTKTVKDEYETATVTTYLQYMTLEGEVKTMVIAIDGEDDFGSDNYAMGALYTYTTYSSKKVIDGVDYKGCAKLTAWNGDDDYTVGTIKAGTELKTSSGKVNAVIEGASQVRLNSKTTYVMVDGVKADVEVEVKTGGINTTVANTATVIAVESNKNLVASIVLLPGSEIDTTVSYEDVIYVAAEDVEDAMEIQVEDEDCLQFNVYNEEGKTEQIIVKAGDAVEAGFYTYSVDEDGIYELEAVEAVELTEEYDDEAGVISGAFVNLYEGMITLTTKFVEDVAAADAVIIDLTEEKLTTLTKIADFEGTVELTMYVDDGAKVIVVTEAVEA